MQGLAQQVIISVQRDLRAIQLSSIPAKTTQLDLNN
jgi:hypothetical protein